MDKDCVDAAPVSSVTASYTEWLTWQLPFSMTGKDYYTQRGTLYVEVEPGSGKYTCFKPVHSTAHDADGFKRAETVLEDTPSKTLGLSQEGQFEGVYDACVRQNSLP